VSKATGNIFQLNNTMVGQEEAQAVCNSQGAQLAIYMSQQEQVGAASWCCTPRRCGRVTPGLASALLRMAPRRRLVGPTRGAAGAAPQLPYPPPACLPT
jgi:hypothetical protein